MPDYHWPPMEKRRVMGQRVSRLDGLDKATGKAKYNSDINPDGLLFGAILTCPYAHARVRSIDTSAAEKLPGVTAVRVIKVEYEVLPHVVKEQDLSKVGDRAKPAGEVTTGDPDKAFQSADVTFEGSYGIPVITHCCLEPHGQVVAWSGDKVDYWPSTQNVSAIGTELARALGVPATQIHTHMDYIGGGFGSKFPMDLWGQESAHLSKASGGKPVKLFLDRATELMIAGNRPSLFAKIKLGAS